MIEPEDHGAHQALPEPFVIGDPGRSYFEIGGGFPPQSGQPHDTACDGYDFNRWSVRAASTRGLHHRYYNTPRQDAYAIRYNADRDRLVVVVCDGVGSRQHSHIAAEAASSSLADHLADHDLPDHEDWTAIFAVASRAVVHAASRLLGVADPTVDETKEIMATTAGVVVIDGINSPSHWQAHIAAIGDGAVWVASRDEPTGTLSNWAPLSAAECDPTDLASTTTSALPMRAGSQVSATRFSLTPGQVLLACTDGIADTFASGTGQVAAVLAEHWSNPPTTLNFAAQVSFGRRSHNDDRTGVAIWSPAE